MRFGKKRAAILFPKYSTVNIFLLLTAPEGIPLQLSPASGVLKTGGQVARRRERVSLGGSA